MCMNFERLRVTHNGGDVPKVCTEFSSTRKRLAIEAFANLKLIARFQDSESPALGSAKGKGKADDSQPPKARSSLAEWSEEDAQWASNGDLDW
jgi:hypothetical protein